MWSEVTIKEVLGEDIDPELLSFSAQDVLSDVITGLSLHRALAAPVYNKSTGECLGLVGIEDIISYVVDQTAEKLPSITAGSKSAPALTGGAEEKSGGTRVNGLLPHGNPKDRIEALTGPDGPMKSTTVEKVINYCGRNPFIQVSESTLLSEVVRELSQGRHRVAVMQQGQGRVAAVVNQEMAIAWFSHNTSAWGDISQMPFSAAVGDRWRKTVVQVSKTTSALEAFGQIEKRGMSGVAVVDEKGRLVSDLTVADIKDMSQVEKLLDSVMTFTQGPPIRQVLTATSQETQRVSLGKVMARMVTTGAKRFYTLDQKGRPVGVVSLTDLLASISDHTSKGKTRASK